jgi:hypothetical protein
MKTLIIALSFALNLGLAVLMASFSRGSHSAAGSSPHLLVERSSRNQALQVAPTSVLVSQKVEGFHWSMLESTNYEVYRDNLRRIGCPESTLADIITGDVNSHYLDQVDVIADSLGQEFWELIADEENLWKRIEARAEKVKKLDNERDEVLDQLLGGTRDARRKMFQNQENRLQRCAMLEFLPPEKLDQCLGIDEKYERLQSELAGADLPPADREVQRKALVKQHEQEILNNLSPIEAAELRLRQSPSVAICSGLSDFSATQDELREIVKILDKSGSGSIQGPLPLEAAGSLTSMLGSDRYALFERARDPRYHRASALAEKLQMPGTFAAALYTMQVDFENLASEIRQQAIDEDDRRDLLDALKSEATRKFGEFIGPELQGSFTSFTGPDWVIKLSHLKP